jgi:hypothetical protein
MDAAASASESGNDLVYSFRPRLVGGEHVIRLQEDGFEFDAPHRRERVLYRDVARLRLSFSPANMTLYRFVAEIWPRRGRKIALVSVSAKGPFNFENRGAAYRAVLLELSRRIERAQPAFRIEAGMARWRWLPAAIFGCVTMLALLYLLVRALFNAQFGFFIFGLIFGGLFVSQIGMMLVRNRPRSCEINFIPAEVLPAS